MRSGRRQVHFFLKIPIANAEEFIRIITSDSVEREKPWQKIRPRKKFSMKAWKR
jgi:hypothetical protein